MALSEKIFTTTFPEPPSADALMNTRSDMEPARLHAENHHWFTSAPAELLVTTAAFTARRMRDGSRDMSAIGIYCVEDERKGKGTRIIFLKRNTCCFAYGTRHHVFQNRSGRRFFLARTSGLPFSRASPPPPPYGVVRVFSDLAIHCFRVKLPQGILGPLELCPRNGLREQELLGRRLDRNHEAPFVCLQLEPHLNKARQMVAEKSRGLRNRTGYNADS